MRRTTVTPTRTPHRPDPRARRARAALVTLAALLVAASPRAVEAQAAPAAPGEAVDEKQDGKSAPAGPLAVLEGHDGTFNAVAFSPDGSQILTSSPREVRVWPADGKGKPRVLRMPKQRTAFLARFVDDERVVIATSHAVYVWRIHARDVKLVFETEWPKDAKKRGRRRVRKLVVRPDGRYLAIGHDDRVSVMPAGGGAPVRIDAQYYTELLFDRSRHLFLVNSDGVRRFAADGSGEGEKLPVEDLGWTRTAAVSPDGKWLAVGSRRATVIDLEKNEVKELKKHRRWIQRVAFTKDGRLLTSSWDAATRLWNVETGEYVQFKPRRSYFSAATVSPDGRYVLTSTRHRGGGLTGPRLWPADGEGTFWPLGGHFDDAEHLAFTADGARILTAADDGRVVVRRVADIAAAKPTKAKRSGALDIRVRTLGERILLIMNGKRLGETIDVALANLGPAILQIDPSKRKRAVLNLHDDTPQVVRLSILKACLEGNAEEIVWKDKRKPIPRDGGNRSWQRERARARALEVAEVTRATAQKEEGAKEKGKKAKEAPIPLPKVVEIEDASAFNPKIMRVRMKTIGTMYEVRWRGERIGTMPEASQAALDLYKEKCDGGKTRSARRTYYLVIDAGPNVPIHQIVRFADPCILDGVSAMIVRGGYR